MSIEFCNNEQRNCIRKDKMDWKEKGILCYAIQYSRKNEIEQQDIKWKWQ